MKAGGEFVLRAEMVVPENAGEITHHFDEPGTYFVSVRVTSQRDGQTDDPFTQVMNLDRARVIVE